jgi:hypothetical protein
VASLHGNCAHRACWACCWWYFWKLPHLNLISLL